MAQHSAFRALADPTRREILCLLSTREMTVAEVSGKFTMTRAAVKKHLVMLEQGGLIITRRQGRETYNALRPEGMQPVRDWIAHFDQFWNSRLTDLKSAIETDLQDKDSSND